MTYVKIEYNGNDLFGILSDGKLSDGPDKFPFSGSEFSAHVALGFTKPKYLREKLNLSSCFKRSFTWQTWLVGLQKDLQ